MDGAALRALRESRGQSQGEFADWLNGKLGRRYDNATISRWESAAERIPAKVAEFLSREAGRPARVIAVANQKGGVAKTTTVASLGVALADQGLRVLLVDLDAQSSLTFSLGVDPDEVEFSVHDVLVGDQDAARAVVRTAEGVDLLPATLDLSGAEAYLAPLEGREFV
ncbi:MAG TPA: AAA family ATPase, partial [Azospirillaceae bacterium]|nr:AAA family ATPase [Azospirillaceae bacterium]